MQFNLNVNYLCFRCSLSSFPLPQHNKVGLFPEALLRKPDLSQQSPKSCSEVKVGVYNPVSSKKLRWEMRILLSAHSSLLSSPYALRLYN